MLAFPFRTHVVLVASMQYVPNERTISYKVQDVPVASCCGVNHPQDPLVKSFLPLVCCATLVTHSLGYCHNGRRHVAIETAVHQR